MLEKQFFSSSDALPFDLSLSDFSGPDDVAEIGLFASDPSATVYFDIVALEKVTEVPVPAGAVLLFTALGGTVAVRRRMRITTT